MNKSRVLKQLVYDALSYIHITGDEEYTERKDGGHGEGGGGGLGGVHPSRLGLAGSALR